MLLFCATLQDTEVSSFNICSPVQKLVPHSLAILLIFATVSSFFCLNRAAFSGIMHIWKHLEDEALYGECFCLFVCCKCGKIGEIFWSPYKVQMDLIAGEWSEACMHAVRTKGKLIICSFVNERNTIPPCLLLVVKTVESFIYSDLKAGVFTSCVDRLEEGSSLQQSKGNY